MARKGKQAEEKNQSIRAPDSPCAWAKAPFCHQCEMARMAVPVQLLSATGGMLHGRLRVSEHVALDNNQAVNTIQSNLKSQTRIDPPPHSLSHHVVNKQVGQVRKASQRDRAPCILALLCRWRIAATTPICHNTYLL
eukprot:352735-Chlamydomonas_euryale.AAC.6